MCPSFITFILLQFHLLRYDTIGIYELYERSRKSFESFLVNLSQNFIFKAKMSIFLIYVHNFHYFHFIAISPPTLWHYRYLWAVRKKSQVVRVIFGQFEP